MNKDGLEKLKAEVNILHVLLLRAHAQFLFWRPMNINENLIALIKKEGKGVGFKQLRKILYWNFILELVKICDDKDKKTPCIRNITKKLENQNTLKLLENEYSEYFPERLPEETEEEWSFVQEQGENERRAEFQETYKRMKKNSDELLKSESLQKYKKVRNKCIGHNEFRLKDGRYELFDISGFGLKYGQERILLESAKDIIDDLQSLVLQSCFSWDSFFIPEKRDVCIFWDIESIEPDDTSYAK